MMFRIFSVLAVCLVVGTLGYSFYLETGAEGVGIFAILAVVITTSVAALLFSPPPEENPGEEEPDSND